MSNDKEADGEPTSWFTIIPDFFYEVIGRIVPGGTFIFALTCTIDHTFLFDLIFKQKSNETLLAPSYTLIFILFLGFSYSLGYLLTPFGHYLGNLIYFERQYKKKLNDCSVKHRHWLMKNAFDKTENVEDLTLEKIESLFQCQHDQVRTICPKLIRSLSKSQADVQLCLNTYAAFFIIFFFLFIKNFWFIKNVLIMCDIELAVKESCIKCIIFFLFAVGFLIAACYRNKRFLARQFSFSKNAQKEEDEGKGKTGPGKRFTGRFTGQTESAD